MIYNEFKSNNFYPIYHSFFNYYAGSSMYNYFYQSSASGGNIVPDNSLVLTNDNSKLLFASSFNPGFDTLYDWVCIFNDGGTYDYLTESRNASALSGNNSLQCVPGLTRLNISLDCASAVGHIYSLQSRNYLKIPESGRTYFRYQGVFQHTGASTTNTTTFKFKINNNIGDYLEASQASWNIDTFINSVSPNPSGIQLDFKKVQTLVFEFYDKNNGSIKCGFFIDGVIYWAHSFKTNNAANSTAPNNLLVFGNLNLPVTDEALIETGKLIRQVGVKNNNSGVFFISEMDTTNEPSLVVSQAAHSAVVYTVGDDIRLNRIPYAAGTYNNYVTVSSSDRPIVSVRASSTLSGNTNRTVFDISKIMIHATSDNNPDAVNIKVIYNGTLTGATFAGSPNSESGVIYDTAATAISGGYAIYEGTVYANQSKEISTKDFDTNYVNAFSRHNIVIETTGGPAPYTKDDTITIVASPIGATTSIDVGASIKGGEIG